MQSEALSVRPRPKPAIIQGWRSYWHEGYERYFYIHQGKYTVRWDPTDFSSPGSPLSSEWTFEWEPDRKRLWYSNELDGEVTIEPPPLSAPLARNRGPVPAPSTQSTHAGWTGTPPATTPTSSTASFPAIGATPQPARVIYLPPDWGHGFPVPQTPLRFSTVSTPRSPLIPTPEQHRERGTAADSPDTDDVFNPKEDSHPDISLDNHLASPSRSAHPSRPLARPEELAGQHEEWESYRKEKPEPTEDEEDGIHTQETSYNPFVRCQELARRMEQQEKVDAMVNTAAKNHELEYRDSSSALTTTVISTSPVSGHSLGSTSCREKATLDELDTADDSSDDEMDADNTDQMLRSQKVVLELPKWPETLKVSAPSLAPQHQMVTGESVDFSRAGIVEQPSLAPVIHQDNIGNTVANIDATTAGTEAIIVSGTDHVDKDAAVHKETDDGGTESKLTQGEMDLELPGWLIADLRANDSDELEAKMDWSATQARELLPATSATSDSPNQSSILPATQATTSSTDTQPPQTNVHAEFNRAHGEIMQDFMLTVQMRGLTTGEGSNTEAEDNKVTERKATDNNDVGEPSNQEADEADDLEDEEANDDEDDNESVATVEVIINNAETSVVAREDEGNSIEGLVLNSSVDLSEEQESESGLDDENDLADELIRTGLAGTDSLADETKSLIDDSLDIVNSSKYTTNLPVRLKRDASAVNVHLLTEQAPPTEAKVPQSPSRRMLRSATRAKATEPVDSEPVSVNKARRTIVKRESSPSSPSTFHRSPQKATPAFNRRKSKPSDPSEVRALLDSRLVGQTLEYLVWYEFESEDKAQWELFMDLACNQIIADFHFYNPTLPSDPTFKPSRSWKEPTTEQQVRNTLLSSEGGSTKRKASVVDGIKVEDDGDVVDDGAARKKRKRARSSK